MTEMPRSERMRMLAGEPYNTRDPELLALAHRARALLAEFHALPSTDAEGRRRILTGLLGAVGDGVWIEPPFAVDYGVGISIGAGTFVNVNCVFLDAAPIRIGADVLIGPGVQLLTVSHPLRASERIVAPDDRRSGEAPYRTFSRPITIGDGAWIGAGTLVMPGVTIGANAVIGAGSIVTADVPANVLALGQPCRVGATALDHATGVVDLVGAVDVERNAGDRADVEHRNAMRAQALTAAFAARYRAGDAVLHRRERVDEAVHRRARADADHGAGHHVGQGGLADQHLQFILGHGECVFDTAFETIAHYPFPCAVLACGPMACRSFPTP